MKKWLSVRATGAMLILFIMKQKCSKSCNTLRGGELVRVLGLVTVIILPRVVALP